ncbi:MAG TPA: hypothetical protein VM582_00515 [Candidatus Thermoplasmatota archaeon]|nr:hypothetical protein [Candidatus Thermoplasmatota archaeon]
MSSNTPTRADALIIERAQQDFEDGLAYARSRIRATHGKIVGASLEALVMGAVAALHVRTRMRDDVRQLLALAHRVDAGEDARALAEQHLDHVLRLKSAMHLIAREDDPEFKVIRAMALDLFALRLPDLARMAAVPDPADFDDLVRKAFPDRAHVDAMIDDNAARVLAIVAHLESHPHVLHAPRALAPKLAAMARDMTAWKVAEVRRGVDEIYAAGSSR